MLCPNCNSNAVLGFVHSDGKHEGKLCLKCGQIIELKESAHVDENNDYEKAILARQEDYL